MRASSLFLAFSTLFVTLAASATVAVLSADFIEARSERATGLALQQSGNSWAVVDVDGLLVRLTGVADSEAMRFAALTAAGTAVDANRIIDRMEVVEAAPPPPRFEVEIFRNGNRVSIIGLVPTALDSSHVIGLLAREGAVVTDLLEAADFPIPAGFETATDFAARAALRLPRSKISITPQKVAVAAAVESPEQKTQLQSELSRLANESFILTLDLSAPRPVVTPVALRFIRDGNVGEFDVCTADSEKARDKIRKAAVRAGLTGKAECTVGLGTPSPNWANAVEAAVGALAQIGSGSITFTDADLTLIAASQTDPTVFDRVVGELQTALPDAFSLHSVLTPSADDDAASGDAPIPEFLATLSPEGLVQLRGRVANDLMRNAVEGFAHARFGAENVYTATRPDPNLPNGWPVRVLAALDALALLKWAKYLREFGW